MKKTQHVQAVYIRKMQALPGKVNGLRETFRGQSSPDWRLSHQPMLKAPRGKESYSPHATLPCRFVVGGAARRR